MRPRTRYAIAGLAHDTLRRLQDQLPALNDALYPGTPLPARGHRDISPSAEHRRSRVAVADREAKLTNLANGITAPGDSRAPLVVGVLDALCDINASIAELEEAVCDRVGMTPLEYGTPADRLSLLTGALPTVAEDVDLAQHVLGELGRMLSLAVRALGDDEPVLRLNGRCPHCDCLSLRVFPRRAYATCINEACRCGDEACACWTSDSPAPHRWTGEQLWDLADEMGDA